MKNRVKRPSKDRLISDIFTKYGYLDDYDFMFEKDDHLYNDFMNDARYMFLKIKAGPRAKSGYPSIIIKGPCACIKNFVVYWYGDEWDEDEMTNNFTIIR